MTQQDERQMIKLSKNYSISWDSRNIILMERYETSLGRGRFAEKSGEYSFREIGYYTNLESLSRGLFEREVIKNLHEIDKLEEILELLPKIRDDIKATLTEYITIDLGELTKKINARLLKEKESSKDGN